MCEICNGYKLKNITKEEQGFHIAKKEARTEKDFDKEHKDFVVTVDLQVVLMSPRSNVSSHYYKTRLCVHNVFFGTRPRVVLIQTSLPPQ